jgi:hypothetical protein
MEPLSKTEVQIMRSMLIGTYGPGGPFLDQLAVAGVQGREFSGVGVFVELRVPDAVAPVDKINTEISEDYRTRLESPGDLVGFTLFIRNGYLDMLEGYTLGDVKWPEKPMENWLILDDIGVAKKKAT